MAISSPKKPKILAAKPATPKKAKGRSTPSPRQTETDESSNEGEGAEASDEESDELDGTDDELGDDFDDSKVIEVAGELVEDDSLLESKALESKIVSTDRGLAKVDALQLYMSDVQRHALLSADEEKKIAEEYHRTGNVDLGAARLVTANLRLVVKLAYEYRRACRNVMDLIQEGNIGLMQAVRRYDPYRGVKLSSYAAWWIRAYMLRYVLNNWRLVKLGTTQAQRKLFFNLNKEKAKLSAMGIEPSHAEIAKRLDVDEKDVIEMDRRLASSDASLDTHDR